MTSQRLAVDGGTPVRTRPFGATHEFGEEDVAAVTHDLKSKVNRMAHVLEPGGAARSQPGPLHHPGVELHDPVQVETRADAGVEDRLVFHQPDRREHRGQRPAAYLTPAGVAGSVDRRLPKSALAFRDRAGSAVDDESRSGRGYRARS